MIRLYGTSLGQGSFSRVTAGSRMALRKLGVLAGFVPLDAYDSEETYPGWDARVAVYIGDPRGVDLMTTIGDHERRYVLLPPNSSWMPHELLAHVAKAATHLLAPSTWAMWVQAPYAEQHGMGISLWRHGVDARFAPENSEWLREAYREKRFHVLHMTSTAGDRKGTRELIEAWRLARRDLGPTPRLYIVANRTLYERATVDPLWRAAAGDAYPVIQWLVRGEGFDVPSAAHYYQMHHVVCQPSRGEGFSLVPLEARCSGVPIVATAATGQGENVMPGPGVIVIPHGIDGPTDDGPGAVSPTVRPSDIANGLVEAYERWPELADEARTNAESLRRVWAWETVTQRWLDECDILGKG